MDCSRPDTPCAFCLTSRTDRGRWECGKVGAAGALRQGGVELGDVLRYTGRHIGGVRSMSATFDKVADIIAETCDIPRENIKPESHAINDLEIDSLDFLDIAFAIDKTFGIKLPLEQWTQEVNDGKATTDQYFVLKNLSDEIDKLIAAKGA
jgi:acyl carrier protein